MKYIKLTQGKETIVDDDLYEWLTQWNWYFKQGYAVRNLYEKGTHRIIRMHRIINQTSEDLFTDHINGDKLDNRRVNLRDGTREENGANQGKHANNTSGYKGIYWHKRDNKWRVQLRTGGKKKYIGSYSELPVAIKAMNKAYKKYHGDFARLV